MKEHCLVRINDTHTYLGGGNAGISFDLAFLYDWVTGTWTELPPSLTKKDNAACGLAVNEDGTADIVVAGGFNSLSVELLHISILFLLFFHLLLVLLKQQMSKRYNIYNDYSIQKSA